MNIEEPSTAQEESSLILIKYNKNMFDNLFTYIIRNSFKGLHGTQYFSHGSCSPS